MTCGCHYGLWVLCLWLRNSQNLTSWLTLSFRDPIRILSSHEASADCLGRTSSSWRRSLQSTSRQICARSSCTSRTLILFFLDTYLWYIIMNMVFSVARSFYLGCFHLDAVEEYHFLAVAQAYLFKGTRHHRHGDQVQAQGPHLSNLERHCHIHVQRTPPGHRSRSESFSTIKFPPSRKESELSALPLSSSPKKIILSKLNSSQLRAKLSVVSLSLLSHYPHRFQSRYQLTTCRLSLS